MNIAHCAVLSLLCVSGIGCGDDGGSASSSGGGSNTGGAGASGAAETGGLGGSGTGGENIGGTGGENTGGEGGAVGGAGGAGGAPVVGWVGEYGAGYATSVVQGAANSFVMSGYVAGTDSFVAKVAADGAVVWQKSFAVPGNDRLFNVRSVAAGGYVAVGYRTDDTAAGSVRLLRLAENGDVTWEKSFTRPNLLDETMGLDVLPGGGFAVSFQTANFIGPPNWVFHLLTTDADGEIVMQSQQDHGLGPAVTVRDVLALPGGDFVIAGRIPQCPQCIGELAALMRIDASGTLVWSKRYEVNGGGVSVAYAVTRLADTNLAIAGTVTGAVDGEAWIAKVNANTGDLMWSKRHPHDGGDIATSITETMSGELIVAGSTYHPTVSTSYAWMTRLDGNGAMVAAYEYPFEGFDVLPEAWPADGGGYIMNGMGQSQVRLLRLDPDGDAGGCAVSAFDFTALEDIAVTATDYVPVGASLDVAETTASTTPANASFAFVSACF